MISSDDHYILRVRRGGDAQTTVEGMIEIVDVEGGLKPFRSLDELWDILGTSKAGETIKKP